MYHELKHYEKRGVASDDKSSNATAPLLNLTIYIFHNLYQSFAHLLTGKDVKMQVLDSLSGILSGIGDNTEALSKTLCLCDLGDGRHALCGPVRIVHGNIGT